MYHFIAPCEWKHPAHFPCRSGCRTLSAEFGGLARATYSPRYICFPKQVSTPVFVLELCLFASRVQIS